MGPAANVLPFFPQKVEALKCSALISHRKCKVSTASRWIWLVAAVRTLNFGRVCITQLPKVTRPAKQQTYWGMVTAEHSAMGWPHVTLPNQCAVTERRASECGKFTQLTQPSYLGHALCTNKVFQYHGVFGHCATLIWGSKRDSGALSRK